MERQVSDVLQWAGDHGGAFLWRRICRDLDAGLRVGVASREPALGARLIAALAEIPQVEWVPLSLGDEEATLGAQDRLLGVHALIWATPVTAPMGSEERVAIEALVPAGAPELAAVVLADWHLLDKLSDDPEAEGAEVFERATALVPAGWTPLRPDQVAAWCADARSGLRALAQSRREAVSRILLVDAQRRADTAVDEASTSLSAIEALLAREDAALAEIRAKGQRAATHLLSSIKRQTQRLQVDLGEFLAAFEADLPDQIDAVEEVALLRHTLPHWLQHVIERWLGDRLAQWRVDLAADLADLPLTPEDLERAELLVPAVQPPLIAGERDWTTRLGATAALGGGVALVLMGMWIPALVAVGGSLGWSAFRSTARKSKTRAALHRSAIEAVRHIGPELKRVLDDQVRLTEEALADLGDERAQAHRDAQREAREELERQARSRRDRLAALQEAQSDLARRIDALRGAA